jgi:hypothetical protein
LLKYRFCMGWYAHNLNINQVASEMAMHAFWMDRQLQPALAGGPLRRHAVLPVVTPQRDGPVRPGAGVAVAVNAAATSTRLCLGIGDGSLRRQ